MNVKRIVRHVMQETILPHEALSLKARREISHLIAHHAREHTGKVVVSTEKSLSTKRLLRKVTPKQRAIEIFAKKHVWDTEENNGVLIYLLVAERKIEIVADRGIDRKVTEAEWQAVINGIQQEFKAGEFSVGLMRGVQDVARLLARHYPAGGAAAVPADKAG